MGENVKIADSNLLCQENYIRFDDVIDEFEAPHSTYNDKLIVGINDDRSRFFIDSYPLQQDEETLCLMIDKEIEHLPRNHYSMRLRNGELDLSLRKLAVDWIWKAISHYGFGPLCFCLSVNYLDRFLSIYEFPRGKAWTVQLLAVACLSLAAKLEETPMPLSVDLQVGDPKFVFEGKTIKRMEILVMGTLKWRLQALTSLSFIDYFLCKINDDQYALSSSIPKAIQLIISTIMGIDFLEFKPSEIAAAVAIVVSGEMQIVDIEKFMSCFMNIEKGRVLKCIDLIKRWSLISSKIGGEEGSGRAFSSVPESPIGLLDVGCMNTSYKTDELTTVGSYANSSHNSRGNKRRKLDL
ncbi:Cyclin, N-terminal [Dillenia turbinata]|uniref:Cyclin, N-terminal n=1 Tax=Dillenia turbinata TaxID=194707 RepID=A0AAN8Z1U9_9MAGN